MLSYFRLLLKDLIARLPSRACRLVLYVFNGGKALLELRIRTSRILWWWFGLGLLLLELLGVVEVYEGLAAIFKTNIRPLTEEEIQRAKPINSWGEMHDDVFIHELVHVWQYERFGAMYIAKALLAQREEGYNYGGRSRLAKARELGGKLTDFNFEQQADIVMDYYRLITGRSVRWGNATLTDISEYVYFVDQLVKPS